MQAQITNSRFLFNFQNNPNFFNKVILLLLIIALVIHITGTADAGSFTSKATGNWNVAATWDQNAVPGPTDDVSIDPKANITISQNVTCNSLTFNNGGQPCAVSISSGITLSVTNNVTLDSKGSGANNMTFTVGDGNLIAGNIQVNAVNGSKSAGIVVNNGTITTNNFTFAQVTNVTLNITGTGILKIAGALTGGGTFVPSAASTTIFNGTAQQTIPAAYNYGNLIIDNPIGARLDGGITTTNVLSNLTVKKGTFDNFGFTIVGNSKTLQVMSGATFALSGTTGLPTGFTTVLDPNSTVAYQGSNQTIEVKNYSNLTIQNAGAKTLAGNLSITGNLSLINAVFSLGNYTLTLEPAANIAVASENGYITMGSAGRLEVKNIGSGGRTGEMLFPVGLTTYTPAYISNAGPADNFSVGIADGIRDKSNQLVTSHVVKKTWNLSKTSNNGQASVTLRLQWSGADEGFAFTRDACTINHYNGTSGFWEGATYGPATGTTFYSASRSGISSFSAFGVGDASSPLPVELVYFKATKKGESALLEWETATEKNNQGFEIQLSADGKNFERLAFVESQNPNSHTAQRYAFTDAQQSKTGLWYYRIKQTDIDGTVAFYGPKVIDFGKAKDIVTAYPNPFSEQFSIKLNVSDASQAQITIQDICGKTVYSTTEKLTPGNNLLPIKLSKENAAGIYLVKTNIGNCTYTSRLIKQ